MARKKEPSEMPGEDRLVRGGYEQNQTVVRLARDDRDPEQLKESLRSFFGELADDELGEQVARIQEHQDAIFGWLAENPEQLDAFVADPLATLSKRFPELKLPAGRKPYVPAQIKVQLQPTGQADPVVNEIFGKLWEYVATSEANTQAFEAAPFAVIASVGAPYRPDKVDQVTRAFEVVFGIQRLATTAGLLDVASAHARRP
jgi:hypothetical protein